MLCEPAMLCKVFPHLALPHLSSHWESLFTSVVQTRSAPSVCPQRIHDGLGGRLVAWHHDRAGAASSAAAAVLGPRQPHWGGESRREPAYAAGGAANKKDVLWLWKDTPLSEKGQQVGLRVGILLYHLLEPGKRQLVSWFFDSLKGRAGQI